MEAEEPRRSVDGAENHRRADYILERGMWKASCRACRWTVENADRQRAAVMFRAHHRDVLKTQKAQRAPVIVELRVADRPAPPVASGVVLGQHEITA